MASTFLGPDSKRFYPDVFAYTCHFLESTDLQNLEKVNHANKDFIRRDYRVYSKYNKNAPKVVALTPLQKLELEFVKFQDRPVWQRVAIVVLCVITSPFVLAYHTPTLIKKFFVSVISPCGRAVGRGIEAIANKIYEYALIPLGLAIEKIATLTSDYALTPLAKVISKVAKFIFVDVLPKLFDLIVPPIARGVWRVLTMTYNYILTPLCTRILAPLGRLLFRTLTFLYNQALVPLARVISVIAKGLLITFPTKVWNNALAPILNWTIDSILSPIGDKVVKVTAFLFEKIIIPIAKVLQVVLKGLCVTFPTKIYNHILTPAGQAIGIVGRFTYDVILTPIALIIQSVASAIFNHLIIPVSNGLQFGAVVLYQTVLSPLGMFIVSFSAILKRLFSGG